MIPVMLDLNDKPVLVVGFGTVGQRKVLTFLGAGARVRVVDPALDSLNLSQFLHKGVVFVKREFRREDLEGVFVAVAATADCELNTLVVKLAQDKGILSTRVDAQETEPGDFSMMARVVRGDLTIGIATGRRFAGLSKRIKCEMEQYFPADYGTYLDFLAHKRAKILAQKPHLSDAQKQLALSELLTLNYEDFKRSQR